jgi:hypothetical protein
VAGKEFAGGKTRAWIRPVDPQNDNAISEQELLYKDGVSADLLDIVTIPMIEPKPQHYHTENHQIDPGFYWAKQGRATWETVVAATDNVAGELWLNGDSSFHGTNDKVAEVSANALPNSLVLIKPSRLALVVAEESQYGGGSKREVRADFTFNGVNYNFVVTDP